MNLWGVSLVIKRVLGGSSDQPLDEIGFWRCGGSRNWGRSNPNIVDNDHYGRPTNNLPND